MFPLSPDSRLLPPFCIWIALFAGSGEIRAQDAGSGGGEVPPVPLSELPERFFQIQDTAGFLWQALDNGALISGETQYLQSGLNLIVDGEPFSPGSGSVREPGLGASKIDVTLKEERGAYSLARHFWFDTRRSGVRVLDSFVNTGNTPRKLSVVLRTTYPFAWQSLHGTGGAVLATEPALTLRPSDISLGVHFSPTEGRHDTFFLFGSEKGGLRPQIKASANSRELVFTYEFELRQGESKHLVHWILQRNLPDVSRDQDAIAPFIQSGQWIDADLPAGVPSQVVNLVSTAFAPDTGSPARLRTLSALQAFTDSLGFRRQDSDVQWLGPNSQLPGELRREGTIRIASSPGGLTDVPLDTLAAVRGGGGLGLVPQWYLRDGRVLVGTLSEGTLSWRDGPGEGGASAFEELDLSALNVLLLKVDAGDGTPPAGATHFLQTVGGAVIAVEPDESSRLRWLGAAGEEEVAWDEVSDLARRAGRLPGWRVLRKDSSTYPLILMPGVMAVPLSRGGVAELTAAQIKRIWRVGGNPLAESVSGPEWVDFSEIPQGAGPASGLLIEGKQAFAGSLAGGTLTFRDGRSLMNIDVSRIERIQRSADPESSDVFLVKLSGGEELSVGIPSPYLVLESTGRRLEFPMDRVLAYRKPAVP